MSDPLAVRLRSEHATVTEQLQAAQLIDSLVAENEKMREALYEIANRAANMSDEDAGTWMPSIYKIACEESGEDPWPLLEAFGHKREDLTVTMQTQ